MDVPVYNMQGQEVGQMTIDEAALGGHKPARATVEVARLPLDARVEIDAIAVRRS